MKRFILAFLLIFSGLFGNEEFLAPLSEKNGDMSSVVGGHVSVITGSFLDNEVDLVLEGPRPLSVSRHFSSGGAPDGCTGIGNLWVHNLFGVVYAGKNGANVFDPSGLSGAYRHLKYEQNSQVFCLDMGKDKNKGLCNTSAGLISARTNLHNTSLYTPFDTDWYYQKDSSKASFTDGCGKVSLFDCPDRNSSTFKIVNETFPDGSQIVYDKEISSKNSDNSITYGSISGFNDNSPREIKGSDGRCVQYSYTPFRFIKKKYLQALTEVIRPNSVKLNYEYTRTLDSSIVLISKKIIENSKYIEARYYSEKYNYLLDQMIYIERRKKDPRRNRVKELLAPVGCDGSPIVTHSFIYDIDAKWRHGKCKTIYGGRTSVFDAYRNKTEYAYSEDQQLLSVTKFLGNTPYSIQKNVWSDKGNLLSRSLCRADGTAVCTRSYVYDSRGNPLEETFEGYSKTFTYSNDKFNLLLTETDGDQTVEHRYYPNTPLLQATFIKEGQNITSRQFFTYDKNNILIETIDDDGITDNKDDLTGVTARLITRTTPKDTAPNFGLPDSVALFYLDLNTLEEKLLKKEKMSYDVAGRCLSKAYFDATDTQRYELTFEVDKLGNITSETDRLGNKTTRTFSPSGNLLTETTPLGHKMVHSYDFIGRLIQTEQAGHTTRKTYNLLSQVVQESDIFGRTTHYTYDSFYRMVKKELPSGASETLTYNILGHVTSSTDSAGAVTTFERNVYGKPTCIVYPDGSSESFVYNLNGTLKESIAKNGTKTSYTYDYKKRILTEERCGEVISNTYSAHHLLSRTDSLGTTYYSYDFAGRLIEEKRGDKVTRFTYDAMGNLFETIEVISADFAKITKNIYDVAGRIVEAVILDTTGKIYGHVKTAYDADGRKTETSVLTDAGWATTLIDYNEQNLPICITNALGEQIHTDIDTDFIDENGHKVLKQTVTDCFGTKTVTVYNVQNLPASIEKINSIGQVVFSQTIAYDIFGQKTEVATKNLQKGESHITRFEYDVMHNVTAVIEPAGKKTFFVYNLFGQKEETIKPDGVSLFYTYDPLGHVSTLKSSDDTIDISYTYDALSNLTHINDHILNTQTIRTFNDLSLLTDETLGNGLKVCYTYDALSRPTEVILPDGSFVNYEYNACQITSILRNDKKVNYTYSQTNKVLSQNETTYSYDLLDRVTSIDSPTFSQKNITYDTAGNITSYDLKDPFGETVCTFTYDDLYQLTSEPDHTYQFDSLYNRTSKDNTPYTTNILNQLLSQGDTAYTYDANGNLLTKNDTVYTYDALNRLTSITTSTATTTYTYDALNRRLTKDDTKFIFLGQNEIGAFTDHITELRLLGVSKGAEIGAAVFIELEGQSFDPISDIFGNLVQLTQHQKVVDAYRYSAFGEEEHFMSHLSPWRFSSKRFDEESGFIFFGRRHFDPTTGRFLTTDPLGFQDGPNLYAYVHNSPLTHIDLYGLCCAKCHPHHHEKSDGSASNEKSYYMVGDRPVPRDEYNNYYGYRASSSSSSSGNYTSSASDRSESSWRQTIGRTFADIIHNALPGVYIKGAIAGLGRYFAGDGFSIHDRNYEPSRNYILREGDPNQQAVILRNGLGNSLEQACAGAWETVAKEKIHPNATVYLCYSASHGFVQDAIQAIANMCGIVTEPVRQLKGLIEWHMNTYGDGASIHIVAHSRGGLEMSIVAHTLRYDIKQRIDVTTVGSAKMIFDKEFKSVLNIVSDWDIVPFAADLFGVVRGMLFNRDKMEMLPGKGIPFADHMFLNENYQQALGDRIRNISGGV